MSDFDYKIHSFSEQSIYISFGNGISSHYLAIIRACLTALHTDKIAGLIEIVPGYNNLTIYYDAVALFKKYRTMDVQARFITEIKVAIDQVKRNETTPQKIIRIPVCYGQDFGIDLPFVAAHNDLSNAEVIQHHTTPTYTVHMLGFSPGFPFLSGLSPELETPRKKTPSQNIPAGSVGIAGKQTGIYPVETPGGWQIIGRTPTPLFNVADASPSLLQAGDVIQFYAISKEEFKQLEALNDDYNT